MEAKNQWMKHIALSGLAWFRIAFVLLALLCMWLGEWFAAGLMFGLFGFSSFALNKVLDYPTEATLKALNTQLAAATHEARQQTGAEILVKYQAFVGELLRRELIGEYQHSAIVDFITDMADAINKRDDDAKTDL